MNAHDLPMVLFTVISQLCVGTFLTLGVIKIVAAGRHSAPVVERVVQPVLYAIGPAMVFGLAVSMLHMNDITNTFNVIRHWDSSWLSREILFGVSFAAFGFLFALMEWFNWGSPIMRNTVAAVAAALGVGLVLAESMIYYSLVTVPAWHSWMVPFSFFATTIMLGALAVGAALMVTAWVRSRRADAARPGAPATIAEDLKPEGSTGGGLALQIRRRVQQINAPTNLEEWTLSVGVVRWIAFVSAAVAVALLVAYPVFIGQLAQGGPAAQASLGILMGGTLVVRLALLALVAVALGFFVYRMAASAKLATARTLVVLVIGAFALALTSELLGRFLHYAIMVRIGL